MLGYKKNKRSQEKKKGGLRRSCGDERSASIFRHDQRSHVEQVIHSLSVPLCQGCQPFLLSLFFSSFFFSRSQVIPPSTTTTTTPLSSILHHWPYSNALIRFYHSGLYFFFFLYVLLSISRSCNIFALGAII